MRAFGKTTDTAQLYDLSVAVSLPAAGPTVYESASPAGIVTPSNAIGTATASPYDHAPPASALLFYQVDDGSGSPPRIRMVRGGSGVLLYFP